MSAPHETKIPAYAEHGTNVIKSAQDMFAGFKLPEPEKGAPQFQYEDYVNQASKMTKIPYMAMHSRLARAFEGRDADYIISYLSTWLHEAKKSDNPGWTFNTRFKKYRDANPRGKA